MASTAWGIDIGEHSIKGVKVARSGSDVRVVAFDRVECTPPQTNEPAEREQRLREALEQFLGRNRVSGPVVVSMPEPAFNRVIPLPPVAGRRLDEIVQYEARQRIPFPLEEVTWAYQPLGAAPGEEMKVAIFAVQNQRIHAFTSLLNQCKIDPDIVQIPSLALLNFATYDRGIQGCTLILDLGSARTDLVITDGQSFWTREIRVSGAAITKALMEKFQISHAEAEDLKREGAKSKQAERLFSVIRPILENLVAEIQRSISHFRTQINKNAEGQRILLAGSTSKLIGIKQFLQQSLGMEVVPMSEYGRLGVSGAAATPEFADQISAFCVATGLAIQGVGLAGINISMLPQALVVEKTIARKKPYAIVGLVVIAGLIGALYYAGGVLNQRLSSSYANGKKQYDTVKGWQGEWDSVTDTAALQGRVGALTSATLGYNRWQYVFDQLNRILQEPELKDKVWLSKVTSYSETLKQPDFEAKIKGEEVSRKPMTTEERRKYAELPSFTCLTVTLEGETNEGQSFPKQMIEPELAKVPGFDGVRVTKFWEEGAGPGAALPAGVPGADAGAPAAEPEGARKTFFTIQLLMDADRAVGESAVSKPEPARTEGGEE